MAPNSLFKHPQTARNYFKHPNTQQTGRLKTSFKHPFTVYKTPPTACLNTLKQTKSKNKTRTNLT